MGIGGKMGAAASRITAKLEMAYTGVTFFQHTGWSHHGLKLWALDYLNHGHQRQRIGAGAEFVRSSNVAALYAPGCEYYEWREQGGTLDESYVTFAAQGSLARSLHRLVGQQGWCHVQDPHHRLGNHLRQLGEVLFSRAPNYAILAHGVFCELLATVLSSERVSPRLRRATGKDEADQRGDLRAATEQFVLAHLAEPLRVADLARHLSLGSSTFAHRYRQTVGESPYQTILRLKMEAAKRLILEDRLSIKETAQRLGFSSEFHFSRAFKQMEGLAPCHYRTAFTRRFS